MPTHPPINPTRVVHISSAHPWTDNRIHLREAASLAEAGYSVGLIAVESTVRVPKTAVHVTTIRRRKRLARVFVSTAEVLIRAIRSRATLVHLHDPELIPAIPVLRALGRRVIYDAHEDLPSQILDKGYLPPRARSAIASASKLLIAIASTADGIVAATETIAERFPASKTKVVKNYPRLRKEDADSMSFDRVFGREMNRPHEPGGQISTNWQEGEAQGREASLDLLKMFSQRCIAGKVDIA